MASLCATPKNSSVLTSARWTLQSFVRHFNFLRLIKAIFDQATASSGERRHLFSRPEVSRKYTLGPASSNTHIQEKFSPRGTDFRRAESEHMHLLARLSDSSEPDRERQPSMAQSCSTGQQRCKMKLLSKSAAELARRAWLILPLDMKEAAARAVLLLRGFEMGST